ncbi:hypothetical protein MBH78_22100 [Oceanimonas sp. NS1]|nr:hypothetical protein [Oceanimonas sp. NS1]
MMQGWTVINISLAYLGMLFLLAWLGDRPRMGGHVRRLRPCSIACHWRCIAPPGAFSAPWGRPAPTAGPFYHLPRPHSDVHPGRALCGPADRGGQA